MSTAAFGMICNVIPVEYGFTTAGFLALDRFPALDALLGVVAGFALFDVELHAADAAVALVEHCQIVVHAVGDRNSRAGIGPGTVGQQRYVNLILRLCLAGEHSGCPEARAGHADKIFLAFIVFLPSFTPGGATSGLCNSPVRFGRKAIFGAMASAMVGNWVNLALSIRKRPHPEFLLADLPQAGKSRRLDDQKERRSALPVIMNAGARLWQRAAAGREFAAARRMMIGKHPNQGRAEEGAHQAAQAADNDHEQDRKLSLIEKTVAFRRRHTRETPPLPRPHRNRRKTPQMRAICAVAAECPSVRRQCPCREPPSTSARCGPRTILEAIQVMMTTIVRDDQYSACSALARGPVTVISNSSRCGTSIAVDTL